MRDAWKGLKTLGGQTKPELNTSNKLGDKRKDHSMNGMNFTAGLTLRLQNWTRPDQIRTTEEGGGWCWRFWDRRQDRWVDFFLWSLTPGMQLVLTTAVKYIWNRAVPTFLLFSVSFSRGLWKNHCTFYLENLCNLSCPPPPPTSEDMKHHIIIS